MEPPRDFCELLECFASHRVDAIVVGAHALAFHGAPRMTGDLDLLLDSSLPNAERVMTALAAFGFGGVESSVETSARPAVTSLCLPPRLRGSA